MEITIYDILPISDFECTTKKIIKSDIENEKKYIKESLIIFFYLFYNNINNTNKNIFNNINNRIVFIEYIVDIIGIDDDDEYFKEASEEFIINPSHIMNINNIKYPLLNIENSTINNLYKLFINFPLLIWDSVNYESKLPSFFNNFQYKLIDEETFILYNSNKLIYVGKEKPIFNLIQLDDFYNSSQFKGLIVLNIKEDTNILDIINYSYNNNFIIFRFFFSNRQKYLEFKYQSLFHRLFNKSFFIAIIEDDNTYMDDDYFNIGNYNKENFPFFPGEYSYFRNNPIKISNNKNPLFI